MGILPGAKHNISLLTLHSETGKAPYDVSMGSQNPLCVGFCPNYTCSLTSEVTSLYPSPYNRWILVMHRVIRD